MSTKFLSKIYHDPKDPGSLGGVQISKSFRYGIGCLKYPVAPLDTSCLSHLHRCSPPTYICGVFLYFRWARLTNCKVLLGLVWHVSLINNCRVAVGPNHGFLRNLRFNVGVSVPKTAHSKTVFVLLLDIGRRHAGWAVARGFIGVNQFLNDIYRAQCAAVRQIWPYPNLDSLIKSLHHCRIVFALTGKVLNTVAFHQGLEVRVEELFALDNL